MRKISIVGLALFLLLAVGVMPGLGCQLSSGTNAAPAVYATGDSGTTSPADGGQAAPVDTSDLASLPSIADVVAVVTPSVVAIDTEVTYSMFRRSFTQEGAGSGWIIDEDGYIVTNNHVVEGAEVITVTLGDGRTFTVDPRMVVTDPANDLAVLQISADNLTAAEIGDSSQLRVGDWVVAIGNPLGMGISAKEGIASRLEVSLSLDGQTADNLIETSAAINPGNSGGPLVNMSGEVIGITSAKMASVGVEGLGYAISINEALPHIKALMADLQ